MFRNRFMMMFAILGMLIGVIAATPNANAQDVYLNGYYNGYVVQPTPYVGGQIVYLPSPYFNSYSYTFTPAYSTYPGYGRYYGPRTAAVLGYSWGGYVRPGRVYRRNWR